MQKYKSRIFGASIQGCLNLWFMREAIANNNNNTNKCLCNKNVETKVETLGWEVQWLCTGIAHTPSTGFSEDWEF